MFESGAVFGKTLTKFFVGLRINFFVGDVHAKEDAEVDGCSGEGEANPSSARQYVVVTSSCHRPVTDPRDPRGADQTDAAGVALVGGSPR